jgi:hypothetical protein
VCLGHFFGVRKVTIKEGRPTCRTLTVATGCTCRVSPAGLTGHGLHVTSTSSGRQSALMDVSTSLV